jgi:hypothetical protein
MDFSTSWSRSSITVCGTRSTRSDRHPLHVDPEPGRVGVLWDGEDGPDQRKLATRSSHVLQVQLREGFRQGLRIWLREEMAGCLVERRPDGHLAQFGQIGRNTISTPSGTSLICR